MGFHPFRKIQALIDPDKATADKAQRMQPGEAQQEQAAAASDAQHMAAGGARRVQDPVTGEDIDVRDAGDMPTERAVGTNVLDTPFPEFDWEGHRSFAVQQGTKSLVILAGIAVSSILLPFLLPPFLRPTNTFLRALVSLLPTVLLTPVLQHHLARTAREDLSRRAWEAERARGATAGADIDGDGTVSADERTRESAEWANALLGAIMPILNTDLLAGVTDMLEDIMQASVPSFIDSVRIVDLGLGQTPARITSIRSLPDAPGGPSMDGVSADERAQLDGEHVNLEFSFSFRAQPTGRGVKAKAVNPHLLIEFFAGIKGVWAAPIPVWVELSGVTGTARARLQVIRDPPFVKTTLITLLGLPKVDFSVVALSKALPNMMDLPFISSFIDSAINEAAAAYVAPRTLTLDLQQLISGDDMKKDTDAIGVLVVHIHRALGIEDEDTFGSADPYVTLLFSKLAKPLYSTRIVSGDTDPVFEETAVLLVDADTVKLGEQLCLQLWDSDRGSVDDVLGVAEVDVLELMHHRGEPVRRRSALVRPHGAGDTSKRRPGHLEYTVGYYGKRFPGGTTTSGGDPGIPEALRAHEDFRQARATSLNDLEAAVLVTPPEPEWPSGILGVTVHDVRDLTYKVAGRERRWGRDEAKGQVQEEGGVEEEEGEGLPSSYVTISLNDDLTYKTRTKPLSSWPMFNASMERFVKDWRTAHVTVTVKESRKRENDAVMGIVVMKLSDLFVNASQISRFYSIEGGVGTGRIRVSLLWRPVDAKLPRTLIGFDSGLLEIRSIACDVSSMKGLEVMIEGTKVPDHKLSYKVAVDEGGKTVWRLAEPAGLPLRQRYSSVVHLVFRDPSKLHHTVKALATFWMRDIADNEPGVVEIALWEPADGDTDALDVLKRNYVPLSGDLAEWHGDADRVRRVGSVWVDLTFAAGLSEAHRSALDGATSKAKKASWDEVARAQAVGMRDNIGRPPSRNNDETEGYDAAGREGSQGADINRNATASSGQTATTGTSHQAVENARRAGTDGLNRNSTATSAAGTLSTTGAVENSAAGVNRNTTATSGQTATTNTSTRAVENANRQSTGASAQTQSSVGAVENLADTPRHVLSPAATEDTGETFPSTAAEDGHGAQHRPGMTPADSGNTVVSTGAVENDGYSDDEAEAANANASSNPGSGWQDVEPPRERAASDSSSGASTAGEHAHNPLAKLKEWKGRQAELGREHRGVMASKPVRTADWIKDNIEEGAHAVKGRFKMKERRPDVEDEA